MKEAKLRAKQAQEMEVLQGRGARGRDQLKRAHAQVRPSALSFKLERFTGCIDLHRLASSIASARSLSWYSVFWALQIAGLSCTLGHSFRLPEMNECPRVRHKCLLVHNIECLHKVSAATVPVSACQWHAWDQPASLQIKKITLCNKHMSAVLPPHHSHFSIV